MAAVSIRYAEALLNSDINKDEAGKNLNILANLYLMNAEFKEMINNPRITDEVKLDIIKQVVYNDKVFINFIALILKEKRFNLINDIWVKYTEMLNRINKVINIEIISAFELTKEEIKEIVSKYKKLYEAKEVKYEIKIDKSLIGGVKVIAEGKVYDDTIKTKLDEML